MKLAIAILLGAWAMLVLPSPSAAHPGGTAWCSAYATDDKAGATEYLWNPVTYCDPVGHVPNTISVGAWLQRAQFSTTNPVDWHTLGLWPMAVGGPFPNYATDPYVMVVSGSIQVPTYFGINCRRVRSLHAVSHGNPLFWMKQSGGVCF